jgi:carbon storage regulator
MLVLSRKRNEQIVIGDDILITVVEIRGDKCRIGVHAPLNIPVHRMEVYEAVKRQEEKVKQEHVEKQRQQGLTDSGKIQ